MKAGFHLKHGRACRVQPLTPGPRESVSELGRQVYWLFKGSKGRQSQVCVSGGNTENTC